MTTDWTPERIEELRSWCEKRIAEKNYIKGIAEQINSLNSLNDQVRRAYEINLSYSELEIMWAMQTRMEKSITMKIKHFFVMVYGKENVFNHNLKGKDYLQHYFTFKDFVEPQYSVKIN